MQGIREYNRKIRSLKNTRKITSSMKMISSVKLQRFNRAKALAKAYWAESSVLHRRVARLPGVGEARGGEEGHVPRALVLLVSSDRGMCGQHNANAIREALKVLDTLGGRGMQTELSFAGTRGHTFFRRRHLPIRRFYEGAASKADYATATELAGDILGAFESGEVDEVWLVYTVRISSLSERPTSERLLPLAPPAERQWVADDVLLEEPPEELRARVVPLVVRARLHQALVESAVSEHAARMSAMDSATTNCDRLMHRYIQLRNRARQAAITTELSEIVTGKEAIER